MRTIELPFDSYSYKFRDVPRDVLNMRAYEKQLLEVHVYVNSFTKYKECSAVISDHSA